MNTTPINRQHWIALLLLLALSHAALALHVSTHPAIDPASCDYCAGQIDPSHAIVSLGSIELPLVPATAVACIGAAVLTATPFAAYRQRAPPPRR